MVDMNGVQFKKLLLLDTLLVLSISLLWPILLFVSEFLLSFPIISKFAEYLNILYDVLVYILPSSIVVNEASSQTSRVISIMILIPSICWAKTVEDASQYTMAILSIPTNDC